jgi:hypothetical protein
MAKFVLTAAALVVASAYAFAPASQSSRISTTSSLNEFVRGYVGGEGPEPIPFSTQQTSVNWDPFDLSGVSNGSSGSSSIRRGNRTITFQGFGGGEKSDITHAHTYTYTNP